VFEWAFDFIGESKNNVAFPKRLLYFVIECHFSVKTTYYIYK
jgi:hypothetical protein